MPATMKVLTDEQTELREILGEALSSSFGDGFYDGFFKAKRLQEEFDRRGLGSLDEYGEDDILALSEDAEENAQAGNFELRKFLELGPVAANKKHDLIEYESRHDAYRKNHNLAVNLMKKIAQECDLSEGIKKELSKFLKGEEK